MKRNDYVVRLLGMLKRYLLWFVASVSVKTANLSIPYLGAYLVSAWLLGQVTFPTFVVAAVVMTVLLVGTAFGDTYISHRMSFGIVKDLRNKCYSKIERLLPATESGKSLGDYERIINSDVDVFEWFYAHILVSWIATALVLMIGAICVARINIVALVVLIICSIALIGIPFFHTKQAEEKGYELRKYGGELNAVIVDGILGMKDIISNQYEEEYTQKLMEKSRQFDRSREKFLNRGMNEKRITELAINISYLMIAGIGVLGGEKDIAKTVTLLLLAFSFYGPLQQTLRDGTNYGFVFGAAKRVYDLLQEPEYVNDSGTLTVQDIPSDVMSLEICNLSFCYPGSQTEVLKNINFSIVPGSINVLVAPSGSGKTTLLHLLERFWDYERGEILINGIELKKIQISELRKLISLVSQDIYLFRMSVRENLLLAKPDATMEELVLACKKANAWEFICELPEGMDTQVGERGEKLSGGQRQRIALAQALLRDTPVILLDEATSNLDVKNEVEISKTLHQLKQDKMILIVAHREATIEAADRIIYLKEQRDAV